MSIRQDALLCVCVWAHAHVEAGGELRYRTLSLPHFYFYWVPVHRVHTEPVEFHPDAWDLPCGCWSSIRAVSALKHWAHPGWYFYLSVVVSQFMLITENSNSKDRKQKLCYLSCCLSLQVTGSQSHTHWPRGFFMHYLDTLSIRKNRVEALLHMGWVLAQNRPNAQKYHPEANLTDALPKRLDICPA